MYKIETGIPIITTGGCSCDQNTDNLNRSLKYRKTKQEEKQQKTTTEIKFCGCKNSENANVQ